MKPFSLIAVLNHRKNLENQAARQLMTAREEEKETRQRVEREQQALDQLVAALTREQAIGIEAFRLMCFEQRISQIEKQLLILEGSLEGKKEALSQAQSHLLFCSRERRLMETLQQKQDQAWQTFIRQKETTALDEIAVLLHHRE